MPGQILAMGGFSLGSRFDDLVLELAGPRVCFVTTAGAHPESMVVSFYESFAGRADPSHVAFDPWPRSGSELSGFPPGYAADDDAALHFVGSELKAALEAQDGARAYRVEPGVETSLETRVL